VTLVLRPWPGYQPAAGGSETAALGPLGAAQEGPAGGKVEVKFCDIYMLHCHHSRPNT
jgi:hypothetical protein